MKLYLDGHAERYALEQLQMSLFPDEAMEFCESPFAGDGAVSSLRRENGVLVAMGRIRRNGRDVSGQVRLPESEETVPLRRRILQQSYYLAAIQILDKAPSWGALAGVRPTKLTTRLLQQGGTAEDCDRMLRDV